LKTNEPILTQIGTIGPRGDSGRPRGQEVKDQGNKRPTLDLEAWRRHQSRSHESSK